MTSTKYRLQAGIALGFKIRGCGWPQKQPYIYKKYLKIGVKMQTLRVITCSRIPQSSKRGSHEKKVPKSHQKSKIEGHFCRMCTYDPMSPLAQPLAARLTELILPYKLNLFNPQHRVLGTDLPNVFNKFQISNFHCHIWIQHAKCTQISKNKLSIGTVVLESVLISS